MDEVDKHEEDESTKRCDSEESPPGGKERGQSEVDDWGEEEEEEERAEDAGETGNTSCWFWLGLLALIPGIVIAAIWTLISPKYETRAEIHVRPIIPWIVFKGFGPEETGLYGAYMNTQVSVMRSPTVLNRALDREDDCWARVCPAAQTFWRSSARPA